MIERRQAKQSVRAANTWNCRGKNRSWNFYFYEGECGHDTTGCPQRIVPLAIVVVRTSSLLFLSPSSSRRHCSRKRGSDLCALVKNKFTAYVAAVSPTSEILLFSTLNRIMRGGKGEELSKYTNPPRLPFRRNISLFHELLILYKSRIMNILNRLKSKNVTKIFLRFFLTRFKKRVYAFYIYYDNESFFDNLYNVKLAFEFTKEEFSIFKKKI